MLPLPRKYRTVQDQYPGIPSSATSLDRLDCGPSATPVDHSTPLAQLMVPVPLSRRAASAIEPVIEGYTVNDSET